MATFGATSPSAHLPAKDRNPPFSEVRPDYAELSCTSTVEAQITTTAMRHNPALGIMTQLMTDGPVPVDRLEISRRRRHLDVVGARDVERAAAADTQIGAGRADQRLGLRQDEIFRKRGRRRRNVGRTAYVLVMAACMSAS
jgi:hypothetical protein